MKKVKISFTINTSLTNDRIAEQLSISLMLRELGVNWITINKDIYDIDSYRNRDRRLKQ